MCSCDSKCDLCHCHVGVITHMDVKITEDFCYLVLNLITLSRFSPHKLKSELICVGEDWMEAQQTVLNSVGKMLQTNLISNNYKVNANNLLCTCSKCQEFK